MTYFGVEVTCPDATDRVKPSFSLPHEVSQLRSVAGRLAWLSRVCRPGMAFGANKNFMQRSRHVEYKIWSMQTSCYHWFWLSEGEIARRSL